MRMTEDLDNGVRTHRRSARAVRLLVLVVSCLTLLTLLGCSAGGNGSPSSATPSSDASGTRGSRMAGPAAEVNVTPEMVADKPAAWVLTSPESAVRSYLAWTSYGYRIGQSQVAEPTMTGNQEVRVNSYTQYNIQASKLIDQTLKSITFGTPSVETSRAVLTAKEDWSYRYLSIKKAGKPIAGPYKASYETTYTVIQKGNGDWVVDSVDAKPLGTVK